MRVVVATTASPPVAPSTRRMARQTIERADHVAMNNA
jgi:hypothetical protein